MLPILYLLTGIATAIPVVWAFQWAVWGAPKIAIEDISLIGSLILLLAALVGVLQARRLANLLALTGALTVWSLYILLLIGAVGSAVNSYSELNLSAFRATPPESPFSVVLVITFALLLTTTLYAAWSCFNRRSSR